VTVLGVDVVFMPPELLAVVVTTYPLLPLNKRMIFLLVAPFMPVIVVPASAGSVITLYENITRLNEVPLLLKRDVNPDGITAEGVTDVPSA
jgi:hypothetical protein